MRRARRLRCWPCGHLPPGWRAHSWRALWQWWVAGRPEVWTRPLCKGHAPRPFGGRSTTVSAYVRAKRIYFVTPLALWVAKPHSGGGEIFPFYLDLEVT